MTRLPLIALLLLAGCAPFPVTGTHALTALVSRPAPRPEFREPFPVFDALPVTGKPRNGIPGLARAVMIYDWQVDGRGLWHDGGERERVSKLPPELKAKALPPREQVQRVARPVRDALLCFDYEAGASWQPDRAADVAANAEVNRSVARIAGWAREANPYARIGFWNAGANFNGGDGREEDYWRNFLEHAAPHVDYLVPAFYVGATTDMPAYRELVAYRIGRLREARKPVYACVNVDGPADKLAEALPVLREHADGLILWCHPGVYDPKAAWRKALN